MLRRRDRRGLSPLRWPRFSLGRISLAMGACGLSLILVVSALVAWREREIAFREAQVAAQNAAFSLADHASRLFEVTDLALRTATLSLGDRSWAEAGASSSLWSELRTTSDMLPYIRDILLTDEGGRLRLGTMAFPTPLIDMSDRSAFTAVRSGAEGLVISDPLLGKITGRPSFLIARRLVDRGGGFRGMASATADLGYFTAYWAGLKLPHDTHVAIVRSTSGTVLVRVPDVPPIAPTSIPALKAALRENAIAGRYTPAEDRSGYYHRIGDFPLVLTVSFSDAAVAAEWRSWLWSVLPFPAAAILALLAIMALARRQSRIEALANRDVNRARAALAAANGRLEQRVAERTADLQESNAEIQRFAYIVSHDLRAPLVNIMGFTSELQRLRSDIFPEAADGAQPEPHQDAGLRPAAPSALRGDFDEAIGFIKTSIDKMDRLIKAILLLARQGNRIFDPEPVDTEDLMRSIADGVAHRTQSAGAEITIGPLPGLVIDRVAAEQVFSNLIDNAVKYLHSDIPGRIVVSAIVEGDRAVFSVGDNGRGIDPRDHGRVFELFRRSGLQDRPGDGIGLAHVRTLVRQLGGTISLESTFGQGSTFRVTLPTAPDEMMGRGVKSDDGRDVTRISPRPSGAKAR